MCLFFLGHGLSTDPGALHLLPRVGMEQWDLDVVAIQCPFPVPTGEFLKRAI